MFNINGSRCRSKLFTYHLARTAVVVPQMSNLNKLAAAFAAAVRKIFCHFVACTKEVPIDSIGRS